MVQISYQKTYGLIFFLVILSCLHSTYSQQAGKTVQFESTGAENVVYSQDTKRQLSPTEKQRAQQTKEVNQFFENLRSQLLTKQFGFQISESYSQFHFHLPTDLTIHFAFKVYVLRNNAYSIILDIAQQSAVYLVLYENNHRIVAQKTFYFASSITLKGKAGSNYMLRLFSSTPKLVFASHTNFVQTSHFEQKVTSAQLQNNQLKLKSLTNRLQQIFKDLRFTHGSEVAQREFMTMRINNFVKYEMLEIAILACVCFLQIKMVSKLFKSQSII